MNIHAKRIALALQSLGILSLFVVAFLFSGCRNASSSKDQLGKVSIGIQVSPAMLLLMVAKDQGFFEQQGLDVELKQFTAGKSSAVTLKPAIRGHFKTGQRDWPET